MATIQPDLSAYVATIQADLSAYVATIQADLSAYVATIQADLSSAFLFNQENVWPIEAFYHTLFSFCFFRRVAHCQVRSVYFRRYPFDPE